MSQTLDVISQPPAHSAITLIAEVASNAGGSRRIATAFIERFACVGANYIKFQLTRHQRLAKDDPQWSWFVQAEWSPDDVAYLQACCACHHVRGLWTVYHPDDVWFVSSHAAVKIGSGEAHSGRLAEVVLAQTAFKRIFVSEGILPAHASYMADPRVVLLGACAHYPAPRGVVGLRFPGGRYQGWSDHSIGLDEAHLAVILGATVIERHVQIPMQAREVQPWESTEAEFAELRHRVDLQPERFLGRWNHGDPEAAGRGGCCI